MSNSSADPSNKDLSSIGKHCSFPDCNLLDFLPVKCELCGRVFCKDHYSLTSHKCEKFVQIYPDEEGESVRANKPFATYSCSYQGCSTRERVHLTCEFCAKDFCMKHRLQVDHECPKLQISKSEPKKHETKEFKFEMKQNVSEKNTALAAKLALMKLKQTAQGPPGLTEQFKYFCFVVIESSNHPFFFSTKWPLGKCVEFVETKLKLQQKNLKFFLNEEQLDTSKTIEELVKIGTLANQGLHLYLK